MSIEEIKALPKREREALYYWDVRIEKISKGAPGAEIINMKIDLERAKAQKIIHKYELLERPITIEAFKLAYLRPVGTNNFFEYFTDELEKRKHLLSKGTFIGYSATVSKVRNFKPNLTLSEIDYKFLTQFENHMLKPVAEGGLGNLPTTIAKTMRTIRTFLLIAIKNNDFPKEVYPFKDYRIKHVDPLLTTA